MQRLVLLVILASLLAGCFSPGGPSNTMPTTPDEYFTGEPTPTRIVLERSPSAIPMRALFSVSNDNGENTLIANIHIRRFTATNAVDYQKFLTVQVPRSQTSVDVPVELPAERRYQVTATIYDPSRRSTEGFYVLAEAGAQSNIAIMAGHTNTITLTIGTLEYTIDRPPELYPGGQLQQIDIRVPREYGITDITRFYGLEKWDKNSIDSFWGANGGHAGTGEPNTGWLNYGDVPFVTEPTKLYYQFRLCLPMETQQGVEQLCAYIPDLDAGEPLFEIDIVPEPTT